MSSFTHTVKDYWLSTSRGCIPYGMGCAWLGQSSDYQKNLRADLKTLETAYRLGFRYFDTAPAYPREISCMAGISVSSAGHSSAACWSSRARSKPPPIPWSQPSTKTLT